MPGIRFETTPERALAIEQAIISKLLAYARDKRMTDPIVRDILPDEDLKGATGVGVSGHIWRQSVSALTALTVYSGTNPDDRAFVIYKVQATLNEPLTATIKFYDATARSRLFDVWQVEAAWLEKDKVAYCNPEDAIFYGESKGYNIDFTAGKNSGIDGVILGGKVVEPRGKTIVAGRVM